MNHLTSDGADAGVIVAVRSSYFVCRRTRTYDATQYESHNSALLGEGVTVTLTLYLNLDPNP